MELAMVAGAEQKAHYLALDLLHFSDCAAEDAGGIRVPET